MCNAYIKISIGFDGLPTFDSQPPDDEPCETSSMSVCKTAITTLPSTTTTTSSCRSVTGCKPTGTDTTTTTSACSAAAATHPANPAATGHLSKRVVPLDCFPWAVVYPRMDANAAALNAIDVKLNDMLNRANPVIAGELYRSQSTQGLGTLFWAVEHMSESARQEVLTANVSFC
jgi:hypothetical protein